MHFYSSCIWKIIRAAGDNYISSRDIQTTFDNVIPFIETFRWFCVMNFNRNRNGHIANSANSYCFGSYCKQSLRCFFCPAFRKIAFGFLVLEIKLKIVGKQFKFVLLHNKI